jgi:hypothetical protein
MTKAILKFTATATAVLLMAGATPALAANSVEAAAAAQRHRAESGKATGTEPAAPVAATATPTPKGGAWVAQFARCKADAGINPVKREKCVWSYCKGNWGVGGCPPGDDFSPKFEKPKFEKPDFRKIEPAPTNPTR